MATTKGKLAYGGILATINSVAGYVLQNISHKDDADTMKGYDEAGKLNGVIIAEKEKSLSCDCVTNDATNVRPPLGSTVAFAYEGYNVKYLVTSVGTDQSGDKLVTRKLDLIIDPTWTPTAVT
jgi:hypothetical protein